MKKVLQTTFTVLLSLIAFVVLSIFIGFVPVVILAAVVVFYYSTKKKDKKNNKEKELNS